MSNTPFGRQPKRVTVHFDGEPQDVAFWLNHLARAAECRGDDVQKNIIGGKSAFVIYPRAVND